MNSENEEEHTEDDALFKAIQLQRWIESKDLLRRSDALRLVQYGGDCTSLTSLHESCILRAPFEIVQMICNIDPRQATLQSFNGHNSLHYACFGGSEEVVALLLAIAPQTAAMPNNWGKLPLSEAIFGRSPPSVIKRLLCINSDAINTADENGFTPLMHFVIGWNGELTEVYPNLDRLTSYFPGDVDGITTFKETFILLLKAYTHGAMEETDTSCWIPLHEALKQNHVAIPSKFLLALDQTMHMECVKPDEGSNFPLHLACAQLPFQNGVDCLNDYVTSL